MVNGKSMAQAWCAAGRMLLIVVALAGSGALARDMLRVAVGAARFNVELAQTPAQRQRGLMFRQDLPGENGMLFVQEPGPAVFWMKNTHIPLDILYFDAGGRLLEIVAAAPPCHTPACPLYPSASAAVRYILEIKGGEAARRGIQPGDHLVLP